MTKPPGPRLWLCIVVIVVGAALGITGLSVGVADVVHEFDGAVSVAPATVQRHLGSGTYEVFEDLPGSGYPAAQVIGPGGVTIPTGASSNADSVVRGGYRYHSYDEFTVTESGDYSITLTRPAGTRFFVSRTFGDLARHAVGWFVMMGFGILIGFAGIVLLIVGIVRRRNARRPPMPAYAGYPGGAQGPPPGWYPDPQLPNVRRWWDGAQWTDRTISP